MRRASIARNLNSRSAAPTLKRCRLEKIEQPPQRLAADQRGDSENQTNCQILVEHRLQPDHWKRNHLRGHCDAIAGGDIRDGLEERHGAASEILVSKDF
jgi:hypothetical protein